METLSFCLLLLMVSVPFGALRWISWCRKKRQRFCGVGVKSFATIHWSKCSRSKAFLQKSKWTGQIDPCMQLGIQMSSQLRFPSPIVVRVPKILGITPHHDLEASCWVRSKFLASTSLVCTFGTPAQTLPISSLVS